MKVKCVVSFLTSLSFWRYAKLIQEYTTTNASLVTHRCHNGKILEHFGLTERIHTVNDDNATSNDMQITKLHQLDNTLKEENWVWCFNHTLQLSAKALLKPFNIGLSRKVTDDDDEFTQDDDSDLVMFENDNKDEGDEEQASCEDDEEWAGGVKSRWAETGAGGDCSCLQYCYKSKEPDLEIEDVLICITKYCTYLSTKTVICDNPFNNNCPSSSGISEHTI